MRSFDSALEAQLRIAAELTCTYEHPSYSLFITLLHELERQESETKLVSNAHLQAIERYAQASFQFKRGLKSLDDQAGMPDVALDDNAEADLPDFDYIESDPRPQLFNINPFIASYVRSQEDADKLDIVSEFDINFDDAYRVYYQNLDQDDVDKNQSFAELDFGFVNLRQSYLQDLLAIRKLDKGNLDAELDTIMQMSVPPEAAIAQLERLVERTFKGDYAETYMKHLESIPIEDPALKNLIADILWLPYVRLLATLEQSYIKSARYEKLLKLWHDSVERFLHGTFEHDKNYNVYMRDLCHELDLDLNQILWGAPLEQFPHNMFDTHHFAQVAAVALERIEEFESSVNKPLHFFIYTLIKQDDPAGNIDEYLPITSWDYMALAVYLYENGDAYLARKAIKLWWGDLGDCVPGFFHTNRVQSFDLPQWDDYLPGTEREVEHVLSLYALLIHDMPGFVDMIESDEDLFRAACAWEDAQD